MTQVLFEPHHDDAVLFASYALLALKPRVVTVLGGETVQEKHGITAVQRAAESMRAMAVLGIEECSVWLHPETTPNWDAVENDMERLRKTYDPEVIWAPLHEHGGHEQHNAVSVLAEEVFGARTRFYATYTRGNGRSRTDTEAYPAFPDWPSRKYAAMACYQSQINLPDTRPWFTSADCLQEWVA